LEVDVENLSGGAQAFSDALPSGAGSVLAPFFNLSSRRPPLTELMADTGRSVL
jgi:hypothetical protein